MSDALQQLLIDNPAVWRGRSAYAAQFKHWPSGHAQLDNRLPTGGWPDKALIELIAPRWGVGEIRLLAPLMRTLSQRQSSQLWVCPPYLPYAPALLGCEINLDHVAVVAQTRSEAERHWCIEKALQSGACGLVLAWARQFPRKVLRRLQLAAEQGNALAVLFCNAPTEHSPAALRLKLSPALQGVRVDVLKARGSFATPSIDVQLPLPFTPPHAA
ncbi:MAG: translesion DNA synthesis-associated protein ImuA [Pseudomonadota bacterium]